MAKIDGRSREAKLQRQQIVVDESITDIAEVATHEVAPKASESNESVKDLIDLVRNLQSQLDEVKNQKTENMFVKGKERYEWPRHYKYRLWGEIPVLSIQSKKQDLTKDYLYKNHKWEYINNHIFEVELADWKTVDVDGVDFAKNSTYSEPQECVSIIDKNWKKTYVFNVQPYGEINVLSSIIN